MMQNFAVYVKVTYARNLLELALKYLIKFGIPNYFFRILNNFQAKIDHN
jgi:hypothetical protein